MAALANTRWELFAIGLASGKTQAQSYKEAGFNDTSGSGNATTLSKRGEIKARVAELIEERTKFKTNFVEDGGLEHLAAVDRAAAEGKVDTAWIIAQLMQNTKDAREANQFSASNQALKMLYDITKDASINDPAAAGEGEKAPLTVEAVNKALGALGYEGPSLELKLRPKPKALADADAA
jgi:hypothetical protein